MSAPRRVARLLRRSGGALAVVAVLALGATLATAAPQSGNAANNVAGFDRIRTDKIVFNINNGDFTLPGHFTATRQGTDVTADRANGNSKAKLLHAQGNVVVHQNQPLQNSGGATDLTQRPSTLTCDALDVDGTRKLYTAKGNMHFIQEGGRQATSDNAVLDDATHRLHMEGHVHVTNGEQTLKADVLDYNTESGQIDGNGDVEIMSPVATPLPGVPQAKPKKKKLPF